MTHLRKRMLEELQRLRSSRQLGHYTRFGVTSGWAVTREHSPASRTREGTANKAQPGFLTMPEQLRAYPAFLRLCCQPCQEKRGLHADAGFARSPFLTDFRAQPGLPRSISRADRSLVDIAVRERPVRVAPCTLAITVDPRVANRRRRTHVV